MHNCVWVIWFQMESSQQASRNQQTTSAGFDLARRAVRPEAKLNKSCTLTKCFDRSPEYTLNTGTPFTADSSLLSD